MVLEDMKLDTKASREMIKPESSPFWQKAGKKAQEAPEVEEHADISSVTFTMDWDDEAKELMKKVPEGIVETAIGNAEDYAKEKGYKKVTKKSIQELMESMGMNLDDILGS
jgi:histone H3/H4